MYWWEVVCESCSSNCDLVYFCISLYEFAVWDRSETHFFVYIYCVWSVRDRMSLDTVYLLCSAGQGRPFFRRRLCLAQVVQCYPNFNNIWPSLSIEWVVGWPESSCEGRLEASEFFWELVTWGHSFFHKQIKIEQLFHSFFHKQIKRKVAEQWLDSKVLSGGRWPKGVDQVEVLSWWKSNGLRGAWDN